MTVVLKGSPRLEPPMIIEAKEVNGEVHLIYNGFAFVVCKSEEGSGHVVEVRDADTGVRHKAGIAASCWRM